MIFIVKIVRYPKFLGWAGVLSMALFHLPLFLNKSIKFYKLMGSGKGGSFSKEPDWNQWALLFTINDLNFNNEDKNGFINWYLKVFKCTIKTYTLKPISCHGTWDRKKCFEHLPKIENNFQGKIAVLTRATIRLNKLKHFWKYVPIVNEEIKQADGLIESYGIGEIPFVKQATLSIWENIEAMKNFSYKNAEHKVVIEKTRKENWYSEEMFARFEVINIEKNT